MKKRFADWDENVRNRLWYATFPNGYIRRYARIFPRSPTIVAFSNSGKHVVGWAFVLCHSPRDIPPTLSLFVNERYRGRRLAGRLVKEAITDRSPIALTVWDDRTKEVFGYLKKRHPEDIILLDWEKDRVKFQRMLRENGYTGSF